MTAVRRWAPILARVLMFALALWLLHRTVAGSGADWRRLAAGLSWPLAALALLLYGLNHLTGACRWEALLRPLQLSLGLWPALRLTLVGSFFSLVLPGAVTGDVAKIAYATQRHPGHALELALVDVLDRIIGLSGLLMAAGLAAAGVLCGAPVGEVPWPEFVSELLGTCLILGLLPPLGFVLYGLRRPLARCGAVRRLAQAAMGLMPRFAADMLRRVAAALALYDHHRQALALALTLSIAIHLLFLSGVNFTLGRALGESALPFSRYALATQVSNATGIISVTPGGIGLRDMAAAGLYRQLGAQDGALCGGIPILTSLVIVIWGLAGAILNIFRFAPRPPARESTSN